MAQAIHRITKEFRDSLDTATADPAEWLIYYKRTVPQEVLAVPPWYRVIDGNDVRVASPEEAATIDANLAAEQAAAAAAELALRRSAAKDLLSALNADTVIALRALIELFVQEINTLRTRAGLPAYTAAQVHGALEAKIDSLE